MTVGAGDARFDQDGTVDGDVVAADGPSVPPPATAPAEIDPPTPADGSEIAAPRPTCDAPAWLSGDTALPWPPREAAAAPRQPGLGSRPVTLPDPPPRPRIVEEPGILGLSRLTRGRFGSRLFTLFFVLVFMLIAVQMVVSILNPW